MTPPLAAQLPLLARPHPDSKGYELTKAGILFHRALTDDEHEALGRRIATVSNAVPWHFGDWLVNATGRYDDALTAYDRLHALTGRAVDTMRLWLKVSLAYEHDERGLVPWTLYLDALRLPKTERLRTLMCAQSNSWTRTELNGVINKRLGLDIDVEDAPAITDVVADRRVGAHHIHVGRPPGPQQVCCPECGATFPVRGHAVPAPAAMPRKATA